MRSIYWLLPVLCISVAAQNSGPDRLPDMITYITHVTVIDSETGKETTDQTVVISDGKISGLARSRDVAVPASARTVDGSGKYLIPGLWDMHVHGTNYDSTLPLYVANGVTGVREMFGPPDANKFRSELSQKNIITPHIYLGSPILDGNPPIWRSSIKVETAVQARNAVDEQKQRGADFIKIYSRLSREAYFAIMDEAQRQSIPVAGHVPDRVTAWEAIRAKQKSLEHLLGMPYACSSREEQLWPLAAKTQTMLEGDKLEIEAFRSYSETKCHQLFDEMKTNRTWAVPTLMPYKTMSFLNDVEFRNDSRMKYFGGEFRDWLSAKDDPRLKSWTSTDFDLERELFRREESLVEELFRAGVPLLAGTDAGNPYCFSGFSLHDELALLVESGLTPLAALQAATSNAAAFMNASEKYGSIAPGKIADLVLLDADPLQDIHNTTKIRAVFLAGKEFDRAALDSILWGAQAAANHATNTAEESQKSEEAQVLKMPGSSAGATDSSNGSAESELRAFMAELRKASIEGDVDTIANSMTDDYVQTDINRQDRATWLNEYFKPLANLIKAGKFHWEEYERKNLQFRFYGECAIVTGELELKGTGAKFGPQHTWVADPNADFSGTLHFTHIYIKQNRKWLLAALHNQLAAQLQ